MGTNECSQPASKSSWDSQDFGDVNKVLKMAHFHKSSRLQWVKAYVKVVIHRFAMFMNAEKKRKMGMYRALK